MTLPQLPEQSTYTLEEITARWACDIATLLRYYENNMLDIKVMLSGSVASRLNKETGMNEKIKLEGLYSLYKSAVKGIAYTEIPDLDSETVTTFTEVFDDNGNEIKLKLGHIYGKSTLRITREERDRFEIKHGLDCTSTVSQSIDIQTSESHPKLGASEYWVQFEGLVMEAVDQYPMWAAASNRKIQKTGNLHDWLTKTIGATGREAEIIKKVLTDLFNL